MKKLIIIIFTMLILSTQLTLAADWYVTQDGTGTCATEPTTPSTFNMNVTVSNYVAH